MAPNVYLFYIFKYNNNIRIFIGMDKIDYIFFQLFDINKIYRCFNLREYYHLIVLNIFVLALKIYIGSLEKLILNGILHNDSHDGNFGFNKSGKLFFIDFGEAKNIEIFDNLFDNNSNTINYDVFTSQINSLYCSYLYDELNYFLDMYYFDDDYSSSNINNYRKLYKSDLYSPIRDVFKLLKNNQYKFGYHLQYVNSSIDINLLLLNINKKKLLKFNI